jgi:UDP-N-acetylglucosamine--N-acetylmuramyl-(pentapeptide) pyrophosphoryl-undecaprenol N-acetylglucosamine transferase
MRVLISGGGTGGHLFPAIAVAQALSRKDPDGRVLYVGRRGGMEETIVPSYGIRLRSVVAAKLDMEDLWRNWPVPFVIPWALFQSARIVHEFRPDVVLGTGGYVSAPVIIAAASFRVPIVLQEQNYLPGRATRLLSRFARVVATTYPESAHYLKARAVVTGTPVRTDFWRRRTEFPPRPRVLLVLGGSQGAHRINESVAQALPDIIGRLGLEVWHQTGERDAEKLRALVPTLEGSARERYHPFPFSDDLAQLVHAADLVLGRAGAGTISEVSAVGIPMLLVPGSFGGGHQRLNVGPFERVGAATVIPDEEFNGPRLIRELTSITDDPVRYRKMVEAMRELGRPYAAEEVVRLIEAAARHD